MIDLGIKMDTYRLRHSKDRVLARRIRTSTNGATDKSQNRGRIGDDSAISTSTPAKVTALDGKDLYRVESYTRDL